MAEEYRGPTNFRPEDYAPGPVSAWIKRGPEDGPRTRRSPGLMGLQFVRFLLLLWNETVVERLFNRAAALTYTTILSLFPALVVVTAIASVFYTKAQENQLIDFIEARFLPSQQVINTEQEAETAERRQDAVGSVTSSIRSASKSFRESAGDIGLVGFLGLLIAAGLLYKSTEESVDAVWKAPRQRPVMRTLGSFTILVVFAPIVFGLSLSASSFVVRVISQGSKQVSKIKAGNTGELFDAVGGLLKTSMADGETTSTQPVISATDDGIYNFEHAREVGNLGYLLPLIPPVLNGLFLTMAYMLLPQSKVRFQNALLGGMIAGVLWELAKVFFLYYAFSSDVRRQLFKTMGVVPLFLIWIYFTWLVFLLGTEISFVTQNFVRLANDRWHRPAISILDGRLYLSMALLIANDFERGSAATTLESLRDRLGLAPDEIETALSKLVAGNFIVRTERGAYLLSRPFDKIQLTDILGLGYDPMPLLKMADHTRLIPGVQSVHENILAAGQGRTLADILGIEATVTVAPVAPPPPEATAPPS